MNLRKNYWLLAGTLSSGDVKIDKILKYPFFVRDTGVRQVIEHVAEHYETTLEEVIGFSRKRNIIEARHVSAHLLYRKFTRKNSRGMREYSLKKIGRDLNKNHATIINSLNKIKEWSETDATFRLSLEEIEQKIHKP